MNKVVVCIPVNDQSYGGPYSAMRNFNSIISDDYQVSTFGFNDVIWSPRAAYQFIKNCVNCQFMIINMFWGLPVIVPLLLAVLLRKQIILVPHGSLIDGRESDKLRKKIWLFLFLKLYRHPGITYHALTEHERKSLRKLGIEQVFVIPNFVVPTRVIPHDLLHNPRVINLVYFGRISEEKGLDLFLSVITAEKFANRYTIDIVGGYDSDYGQKLMKQFGCCPNVKFLGARLNSELLKMLSSYHYSVLPSKSECLSMSLLESICHRLPVLVSKQSNFQVADERYRVGFMFDRNEKSIEDTLTKIGYLSDMKYQAMVTDCYSVFTMRYSRDVVKMKYLAELKK